MIDLNVWRWRIGLAAVGTVIFAGCLWWALADLVLATFEIPSKREQGRRAPGGEASDVDDQGPLLAA